MLRRHRRWFFVLASLLAFAIVSPSDGGCSYCSDNPNNCA